MDIVVDFDLNIINDKQISILEQLQNKELRACLQQLKIEVRDIIFLAYFKHQTYKQIAVIIGKPVNTIKSMIIRSLPQLKKCIEGYL